MLLMPLITFILALRTPEGYKGSPRVTPVWTTWCQRLDANVINLGHPVVERSTVGNCGMGTVLRGYSLITIKSREGALMLARECPIVAAGGGLEVGHLGLGPKQTEDRTG
jgi:hypothetical protein